MTNKNAHLRNGNDSLPRIQDGLISKLEGKKSVLFSSVLSNINHIFGAENTVYEKEDYILLHMEMKGRESKKVEEARHREFNYFRTNN